MGVKVSPDSKAGECVNTAFGITIRSVWAAFKSALACNLTAILL
ncbi:MAG: hypothetical protein ACI91R_000216 [Vicingaceae bacterium]|jgi:hypothetical protein